MGTQTGCLQIAWPGMQTNAAHSWGGEQPDIRVWYGGLVDGMRDASGQMYMRNRYYDPATGQFTQTDPIGLAGGLNAYGFAAGDPVSYSDPYGLRAEDGCDPPGSCFTKRVQQGAVVGIGGGLAVAGACTLGTGGVCALGPAEVLLGLSTAFGTGAGIVVGAGEELAALAAPLLDAFEGLAPDAIASVRSLGSRIRRGVLAGLLGIGFGDGADGESVLPTTPTDPCGDGVRVEQCTENTKVDTASAPHPDKSPPE